VRERICTFNRPEGGLILAAGNAILPDTPLENLYAYGDALYEPRPSCTTCHREEP
jgi:hypothetical protein